MKTRQKQYEKEIEKLNPKLGRWKPTLSTLDCRYAMIKSKLQENKLCQEDVLKKVKRLKNKLGANAIGSKYAEEVIDKIFGEEK